MQGFPEGYDQDIIYNSSLSLLSGPIADEKKVDSTVDLTRNDARTIKNSFGLPIETSSDLSNFKKIQPVSSEVWEAEILSEEWIKVALSKMHDYQKK